MYKYFIHFNFVNNSGNGDGNNDIVCDRKIESLDSIADIEAEIKKQNSFKSVVIDNFILLSAPNSEEE